MSTNQSNSDTSVSTDHTDTITAIDLFCGAGGFSKGLKEACYDLGYDLEEAAINHWYRAIETHEANNPSAEQYHSKVEQLHPPDILEEVSGSKETNVELLVAGPECTHHSRARGGKPVKEQRRMSPWLVLDWLEKLNIDKFIIENVPEIQSWGPVDSDGQPIRDGSIFSAWVNALNSLGYAVDWTELTAKDYGDPTSRKRFFIMGTKQGKVTFPSPTHSDTNDALPDYRKAADIIDWDDLGDSIWTRDITHNRVHTPPAETTLKRIGEGIKRHCSEDLLPFADTIKTFDRETIKSLRENRVVPQELAETFAKATNLPFFVKTDTTPPSTKTILLRQQDGAHPINIRDRSVPTIATRGGHSIVSFTPTPMIEPKNGLYGGTHSNPPYDARAQPTNTLTTDPQLHLLTAYLTPLYSSRENQAPRTRSIDRPLMTIPASKSPAGVVTPEIAVFDTQTDTQKETPSTPNIDPLDTLTETEELVLCLPEMWPVGLNISYRMLKPKELKQAQGFPEEYTITGNKSEKCEQIGNAVPVNMAKELCKHALTNDSPSLSSFGGGVSGSSETDIPDYDEVASVRD